MEKPKPLITGFESVKTLFRMLQGETNEILRLHKNRFNQVACVGEAEEFQDGQIALDLDVTLPEKTKIILTPQQQNSRLWLS